MARTLFLSEGGREGSKEGELGGGGGGARAATAVRPIKSTCASLRRGVVRPLASLSPSPAPSLSVVAVAPARPLVSPISWVWVGRVA